jgi:hypothetical protein
MKLGRKGMPLRIILMSDFLIPYLQPFQNCVCSNVWGRCKICSGQHGTMEFCMLIILKGWTTLNEEIKDKKVKKKKIGVLKTDASCTAPPILLPSSFHLRGHWRGSGNCFVYRYSYSRLKAKAVPLHSRLVIMGWDSCLRTVASRAYCLSLGDCNVDHGMMVLTGANS